jgi:hypothetical protein
MAAHTSLKSMAEAKTDNPDEAKKVQKASNSFLVDPRIIKIEQGFNVRFMTQARREYIDAMKEARKAGAVFPAIDVRVEDGDVTLVDGENRLIMTMELIAEGEDIEKIECRHFRGNNADRVAHMVGTGQQGLKLTPLESGHGYRRLISFGWSVARIAAHSRVSDTTVEQGIMLAEADMEIQEMVMRDEVPAHIAVEVVRKHGGGIKALNILEENLAKARATGGKKVTGKILNGPTIPRKVVGNVVSSLKTFYTRLSEGDRANMETLLQGNEAELEGKTVSLSAASLKALFDAHQEVEQVYMRAKKREELRKARASAQANAPEAPEESTEAGDELDDEFSVDDVVAQHLPRAA